MNFNNDEEAIDFFNRLLERLHQADMVKHGSKIELVYVAPGAQHVETQYISLTPDPSPSRKASPRPIPAYAPTRSLSPVGRGDLKGEIAEDMPEPLATEEAMALWEKARAAGYVDDDYQPLISRTQAALLADAMAVRLGIREKWKVFEGLWNRKYMRSDYNLALTQQQSLDFQDELKRMFE